MDLFGGGSGGDDLPLQPNTLLPGGAVPNGLAPALMPSLPVMPIASQASANPWQDVARMLQGFSSGVAGRPNPVIQLEQQQQQIEQQRARLQQQQYAEEFNQRLQLSQLALQERARDTAEAQFNRQEKLDAQNLDLTKQKMGQEMGLKLIDSPDAEVRTQGYKMLQQVGGLSPDADPGKLAVLGNRDYAQKRNEAISFIENGIDPEDPAFAGSYSFLPLKQYKAMHATNPLGLNPLRSTPMSEDALLKAQIARISSMPEEAVVSSPTLQAQLRGAQAALNLGHKVDYGVRVNSELGAMGYKNPQAAPPEAIAEAIRRGSVEQGPPDLSRLVAREQDLERKIATAQSPEELAALKDAKAELLNVVSQKRKLIAAQAEVQGAKTAAGEAQKPLPEAAQKDLGAYNQILATLGEFKSFTPEEIKKYTGILNNPVERAKMAVNSTLGRPVDERFAMYQSLMGRFQHGLFALGGKALTVMEMRVASMSTPTGREAGGATEMLAKVNYLEKFTKVSRDTMVALHKVGKGYVDPDMLDRMMQEELDKQGIGLPSASNPRPWMPKSAAPAGYKPVR